MKIMKIRGIVYSILIVVSIFACTQTEKVINPIDESDKYFVAISGADPKLKVIELPGSKILTEDFFADKLKINVNKQVTNIKEFGGLFYIIVAEEYKIFVVRKNDNSLVKIVDFSDEKLEPSDIVFANSTDAYISHNNSVFLTLLDITNFVKARQITVGNPPHSIAVSGNQIYVSNQPDNTLSVVDSRDKRAVATLLTEPNPTFVKISPDGKTAMCVCIGLGKLKSDEQKTPAVIQYYDIQNRNLIANQELGFGGILPADQIPQGIVVTQQDWGFIPTNENFLRIDVRTKDKINLITKRNFYFINFDSGNSRLILLREVDNRADIIFADDRTGEIGDFFSFPFKINFVTNY